MASEIASSSNAIIVGIDFGTTYSGVAWCWSENFRPENINIVTGWESIQAGSHDSKKVPSTIRYLKDEVSRRGCDSSIDGKQGSTWGYTVRQDSDPFAWFKLLLLNETDLPPYTQEYGYLRKMRTRLDKEELEPVDVTGDYLRRLWNHVHSQIANEIGGDEALRLANIKVVMTIPAIWPSYAMDHMRAAADAAGIMNLRGVETSTTLTFISEPEAAACATLTDFKSTGRVSVGDTLTIVDAGGGTVDLISYEVTSMDPFKIKEIVEGAGGLCGAKFLDEEFDNVLRQKIGLGNWLTLSERHKAALRGEWENGIKPGFRGGRQLWPLPEHCFPGPANEVDPVLSAEEVKSMFEPIVSRIEGLVRAQVDGVLRASGKPSRFIVLVGGFGRSKYLFKRISELFTPPITVMQGHGDKPWTAICRGAVINGALSLGCLNSAAFPRVESRISRMSYGVTSCELWDDQRHVEGVDKKHYSTVTERWLALNRMKWFIKRGDNITGMEKASYPSGRVYDPNTWWWTPNLTDEIYQCADEVPPIRMVESVKLKATLSMVYPMSFDDLEFGFTHTGKKYKYLDYDRIVTIVGTAAEVVPYYNKKKIGETSQVLVAVEGQGGTQESAVPVPTAEKANGPHGWGSKNGLGFGDEDEDDALYGG